MEMLKVEDLHKNFGGLRILKGVSFDIGAGERLGLIGPNGAGKSTLINVIVGQLSATSGRIYLSDRNVISFSPNRRLRMGMGRSFQNNNLFFQLTVMENVLLALYGAGKSHFSLFRPLEDRKDLLSEAQKLLVAVGLWNRRHDILGTLSYGEQRLIEFAFSVASKPNVILLDEPSAGMPTAEAANFANTIRSLSSGAALIFCAHDLDLVFNLADKIMVLYFGRIIAKGLPHEIRSNPKVQEIYLGSEEQVENVGA